MAAKVPSLAPQGGFIHGILAEWSPTKTQLDAWIAAYKTPNTWTLDSEPPQPPMEPYFAVWFDYSIVIDLKTMKIVSISHGHDTALADLQRLLQ